MSPEKRKLRSRSRGAETPKSKPVKKTTKTAPKSTRETRSASRGVKTPVKPTPVKRTKADTKSETPARETRSMSRELKTPLKELKAKPVKKTKPVSKASKKPVEKEFSSEEELSETESSSSDELKPVKIRKVEGGALKGRSEEYDSLRNWILESHKNETAVSVYMSGQPGTGKTATTKRVLESLGKSVRSSFVNCASTTTKSALLTEIFRSQHFSGKATEESFEKNIREITSSFVLVLDEIDHLVSRSNSTLYSAFRWPYSLSHKIIIIGIANSIDLTERLLPKLMLSEPPKRLVFDPYTKDSIVEILTDKMKNEQKEIDGKAVELCARKVASMSGDLRTALHIIKQTKHRIFAENQKIDEEGAPIPPKNGCREVLGVINNVYSSPLARARLPFQPRILLAVCLALSSSKKTKFDRNGLMTAYSKTCNAIRAPEMDEEDLMAAFQTLESQSFIRQLNDGKLVLQVDSATARSAISDNSMLDQIALLNF